MLDLLRVLRQISHSVVRVAKTGLRDVATTASRKRPAREARQAARKSAKTTPLIAAQCSIPPSTLEYVSLCRVTAIATITAVHPPLTHDLAQRSLIRVRRETQPFKPESADPPPPACRSTFPPDPTDRKSVEGQVLGGPRPGVHLRRCFPLRDVGHVPRAQGKPHPRLRRVRGRAVPDARDGGAALALRHGRGGGRCGRERERGRCVRTRMRVCVCVV